MLRCIHLEPPLQVAYLQNTVCLSRTLVCNFNPVIVCKAQIAKLLLNTKGLLSDKYTCNESNVSVMTAQGNAKENWIE